jgi:hypothetical protein
VPTGSTRLQSPPNYKDIIVIFPFLALGKNITDQRDFPGASASLAICNARISSNGSSEESGCRYDPPALSAHVKYYTANKYNKEVDNHEGLT